MMASLVASAHLNDFQQSHIQTMANNLKRLFAEEKFLDVTLSICDQKVRSNRMLLSSSSDYFRALFDFYGNQSTAANLTETVLDLTSDYLTTRGFEFVIDFLHSIGLCCTPILPDDYEAIYAAASFLQVPSLQAMLSNLIGNNLNAKNVLGALKLADTFGDDQLYKKSMLVLLDQFQWIDIDSDDFLCLSEDHIRAVFSSDRVNVLDEGHMVRALLSWLCHDVKSRWCFFHQRFPQFLRLSLVKSSALQVIAADSQFANIPDVIQLLVWTHRSMNGYTTVPEALKARYAAYCVQPAANPRTGTKHGIYAFGGVEEKVTEPPNSSARNPVTAPEFFSYDAHLSRIQSHPSPDEAARVHHAVTSSISWLYITGGESEEGELMNHCARYNLIERKWLPMSALDAPRSHHSLVQIENYLYALGGYRVNWLTGYSPATDSIRIYDGIANHWTAAAHQLPFAAIDMGVVLLPTRRLILIAGGLHEHGSEMRVSDLVTLYDPAEDRGACFTPLPRLPIPLYGLAVAYTTLADRVIVCGGKSDEEHANALNLLSGHVFAFDFNSNRWSTITVLDYPRYYATALISGDTLYVLGGVTVDESIETNATRVLNQLTMDSLSSGSYTTSASANNSTGDLSASDRTSSLAQLCHVNPQRPSLLQAPYHTCHFAESWSLLAPIDDDSSAMDATYACVRISRHHCKPTRRDGDDRVCLSRCLAAYCLAPYFP